MFITGKTVQQVNTLYGEQMNVRRTEQAPKRRNIQAQDEVILSSQAQGFSHVLSKIKQMPEVRPELVQEFSNRIAAGNYHVSGRDIADKMLTLMKPCEAE